MTLIYINIAYFEQKYDIFKAISLKINKTSKTNKENFSKFRF